MHTLFVRATSIFVEGGFPPDAVLIKGEGNEKTVNSKFVSWRVWFFFVPSIQVYPILGQRGTGQRSNIFQLSSVGQRF